MDCTEKIPMTLQDKHAFELDGKWVTGIMVSCGRCPACIMTRKQVWGFRMMQEIERSHTAYFVTLTYSPEHVPYDKYGNKVLRKGDLQDFFKRLRQHTNRGGIQIEHLKNGLPLKPKIKYFACGEYGKNGTKRPHYHAVIFNTTERAIYKSWAKGDVMTAKANKATIAYIMKYLDKLSGESQDWRKPPEFQLQSKGIGENYIEKYKHFHKANLDIQYMTDRNGIKYPIPDSFRPKLYSDDERREALRIINQNLNEERNDIITKMGQEGPSHIAKEKRRHQKVIHQKQIRKQGSVDRSTN